MKDLELSKMSNKEASPRHERTPTIFQPIYEQTINESDESSAYYERETEVVGAKKNLSERDHQAEDTVKQG